jgi:hypothetical protein
MPRLPLRDDWAELPDQAEFEVRLAVPDEHARQAVTVLLTVQVMHYLHGGGYRLSL